MNSEFLLITEQLSITDTFCQPWFAPNFGKTLKTCDCVPRKALGVITVITQAGVFGSTLSEMEKDGDAVCANFSSCANFLDFHIFVCTILRIFAQFCSVFVHFCKKLQFFCTFLHFLLIFARLCVFLHVFVC